MTTITSTTTITTSTTTSTTTTTATTTTSTTTVTPKPCPPTLPEPTQRQNIVELNYTATVSVYSLFTYSFRSPLEITNALLLFEFQSRNASWYLDDVSLKKQDGGNSEVLENGNFGNGFINLVWEYCYPKASYMDVHVVDAPCHAESYCFASRSEDNFSDYLAQQFPIDSNSSYQLQFYASSKNQFVSMTVSISFH